MALSAAKQVLEKDGVVRTLPMGVDVIYKGALCTINAAGFVMPAGLAVSEVFAGIAEETVDNSAGSAGDKSVKLKCEGRYLLTGTSLAQGDVNNIVYAADDATITKTAGTDAPIGTIDEFVSATQVWVKLSNNPLAAAAS